MLSRHKPAQPAVAEEKMSRLDVDDVHPEVMKVRGICVSTHQVLSEAEVMTILRQVGAIITDSHLVYTSGRHGRSYVNKDALYPHTAETSKICGRIAEQFVGLGVDVVAGPTIGGVIMAQWVAHHLSQVTFLPVLAVYAEEVEVEGKRARAFRRGYADIIASQRVLIVEDILTTGGSVRQVIAAVQAAGGTVVGVGALCNRGNITAQTLGVPTLTALVNLPLESWEADTCPLCQQGVPINTRVGKGAAFVRQRSV